MSAILSKNRRGVTLVELLIVISILLGLLALAVPAMRPAMESKQIRDAARAVNVYFSTARSRAIETGRPCGVLLERDPNLPQACITLRQVEVPLPYSGDTTTTYVTVQLDGSISGGFANVILTRSSGSFSPDVLRIGDRVQINYQGPWYEITDAKSFDSLTKYVHASPAIAPNGDGFPIKARANIGAGGSVPWTSSPSQPLPITVLRQPVSSSTPALQLPARTAIDLVLSGPEILGVDGFHTWTTSALSSDADLRPVLVMFSSTGAMRSFTCLDREPKLPPPGYYLRYEEIAATSPVYLLVGRRDRVSLTVPADPNATPFPPTFSWPAEDGMANDKDLNNLFVSISPQTGLITTSEIALGVDARKHAREHSRMGGQ